MNKQSKIFLAIGLVIFSLVVMRSAMKSLQTTLIEQKKNKSVLPIRSAQVEQTSRLPSSSKQNSDQDSHEISDRNNESLINMLETLSLFTQGGQTLTDLLSHLRDQGEKPFLAQDQNLFTGAMVIVRTNSPLSGTRYFHAQYFRNESGEPFVQHMSFEYKPSPTAMTDVVSQVEKSFSNLGTPTVQREDYMQWNLGEDHIVWVKKMGPADLNDDPFNSYSPEDVGTIRVAVELEIHDRETER